MAFVRAWTRALLGVSPAVLLVPVGLVVAVAVAASVGGSGLGRLGQLVGGPAVPSGQEAVSDTGRGRAVADVPTVPVVRRPSSTAARSRARARRSPRPAGTPRRRPAGPQRTPVDRGNVGTQRRPKPKAPAPAAPTPAPASPTPPAPAKAPANPVRRVGTAVAQAVAPLPVLGPPLADAVGTVVDLIAPPPK